MDLEYLLENPKGRCLPRFIRANFPEEYEIISKLPGEKFSEKIYRYFHPDAQNVCVVCGKPTKFRTIQTGFARTCSIQCLGKDPERTVKSKRTCLEKYGDENFNNRAQFLETMDGREYGFKAASTHETIRQRYGVQNISQLEMVKRKKEETCLKNHGVSNALLLERVKEAGRRVMIKKYGTDALFKIPEFRKKAAETERQKFITQHPDIISILDDNTWICRCPHGNCTKCQERTYPTRNQIYNDRKRNGSEMCTKLLPIGRHNQGTTIELFVRNILDQHNIPYQTNVRNIISPKEVDIFIPSHNIAIECNGVYWHSLKPQKYHLEKFEACESTGVQLLTIWEDWVVNKPEQTESLILSKLGMYKKRIGASRCKVGEVPSKQAQQFFELNHIQGRCKSVVRLGLYYKDELVGVMAFNKRSSWAKDDCWELIRFCTLCHMQVVGGAERLLKHFISHIKPVKIVSFSSNDISTGALYKRLKFQRFSRSLAYWYIGQDDLRRYHRTSFCKTRLGVMGFDISNQTEREIMEQLPYWRIYDSGTTGWELLLK